MKPGWVARSSDNGIFELATDVAITRALASNDIFARSFDLNVNSSCQTLLNFSSAGLFGFS